MNIDEIIRKCVEVPGISIERGEYSAGLFLNGKDGKGSVTFFPLFSGLTLAYISVNAPLWTAPELHGEGSEEKGPLLLNYCVTGRCEIILNNGNFVYVTDGDLSLTEHFAQRQYVYPRRIYEGLEFFIELDTLAAQSAWLLEEFGLDFHCVVERYCRNGSTYISKAVPDAEELLKKLWPLYHEPMPFAVMQMKLYSLALFSLLMAQKEIPPSQVCAYFTETQVNIAKQVEQIITADLRQHHPAWELAARFSISETSMKNYFRGVFGQNISEYLREVRMRKAAELLTGSRLSVSEVAEQVGYINQSKFASVFKKQFGMSPLEYRRRKHLECLSQEKP